jgi:hypothetical protein
MEAIETKDIITFCIAVYGASLATFNQIQSILKDRRRITVAISPSFFTYADGSISSQMASIEVVNRGHRPAVVSAPALQMPNGKLVFFTDSDGFGNFPTRLEDGEKASISVKFRKLADALKGAGFSGKVTVRPSCKDTTNKRYWGKRWKFDADGDWKH